MQSVCPRCHNVLQPGERPLVFCGYCGYRLADTDIHLAETQVGVGPDPSAPAVGPGAAVGDYELLRELGSGGMGVVWEAAHRATGRRVAIKLLNPRLLEGSDSAARFYREARMAASLSHERITFVLGAGEHNGQPYLAMELMPGRTLKHLLDREKRLPVARAVEYVLEILNGLEAAHARGMVHRDIKPSNCFFDGQGRLKLGDFGLARSVAGDASLTRTGTFLGTPHFASPEQIRGERVDARTDIYAVGAMLFNLIAGRNHFEGDAAAVIAQIASETPPRLSRVVPDVPRELDRIVARALSRDPSDRFQTVAELRQALLPFASTGTGLATLGRRLAAFMVDDMLLALVVGAMIVPVFMFAAPGDLPTEGSTRWSGLLGSLFAVGYFAAAEGIWGCTLGKLVLGLRVASYHGMRAGVWRGLWRACVLPGGCGVGVWLSMASTEAMATAALSEAWNGWTELTWSFVRYLPGLVCLVTMRRRNGFRGLHEFASGTRVVRLRRPEELGRFKEVPRFALARFENSLGLGPYRPVGKLGDADGATLLVARDDLLQRHVWIYVYQPGAGPMGAARHAVERPTRQRWLQHGHAGDLEWDAVEALEGVPLADLLRLTGRPSWDLARWLLKDLADELAAAQDDGTLPATLSLDQVWIDEHGRVRFVDVPPVRLPPSAPASPFAGAAQQPAAGSSPRAADAARGGPFVTSPQIVPLVGPGRAARLLLLTAHRLLMGTAIPVYAQGFLHELGTRLNAPDTLGWACQRLRALVEAPGVLRWDERLGMFCVSAAIELTLYGGVIAGTASLLRTPLGDWRVLVAWLTAAVLLPGVVAWFTNGGAVFRLMGLEVRRSDGLPAGRLRRAWRGLLAWLPFGLLYAASAVRGNPIPHETFPLGETLLTCAVFPIALLIPIGIIWSLVNPARGLQDVLSGTCLARQ